MPQLLGLLGDEVGQTSVNVTGGDGVDTGKVPPLVGKRASHVNAASLCDVVRGLLLGEVGDVARHGGSEDERARLALAEVQTNGTGAVEAAGQVGLDDLVPLLDSGIKDTVVGSLSSVGDEDIDLAKVLDNILDELLDVGVVVDLALVCLDLDAVLLTELLCVLLGTRRARVVCDGEVGTKLSATTGGFDSDTGGTRGTGDDDDLALEGEEVLELGSFGDGGRHVEYMKGVSKKSDDEE